MVLCYESMAELCNLKIMELSDDGPTRGNIQLYTTYLNLIFPTLELARTLNSEITTLLLRTTYTYVGLLGEGIYNP